MYSIWIRHRFVADICTCTGAYCTLGLRKADATSVRNSQFALLLGRNQWLRSIGQRLVNRSASFLRSTRVHSHIAVPAHWQLAASRTISLCWHRCNQTCKACWLVPGKNIFCLFRCRAWCSVSVRLLGSAASASRTEMDCRSSFSRFASIPKHPNSCAGRIPSGLYVLEGRACKDLTRRSTALPTVAGLAKAALWRAG